MPATAVTALFEPHTFELNEGPIWNCYGTTQQPRARVRAKIEIYNHQQDLKSPVGQFVAVDLAADKSTVSPGKLYYEQPDKCGGFTDRVGVSIWFAAEPRLTVWNSAPDTTTESGSISASSSYSLSGGLFGVVPTGNVSGSFSSGSSQTLKDFIVINSTAGTGSTKAKTVYWLNMLEGGTPYFGPPDLINPSGTGSMRKPTNLATSDLPILSSALFHSPEKIDGTRTLHIRIEHRVMTVEKTWKGPMIAARVADNLMSVPREHWDEAREFPWGCDTGLLAITTRPLVVGREWRFSVDLKNGAVEDITYPKPAA